MKNQFRISRLDKTPSAPLPLLAIRFLCASYNGPPTVLLRMPDLISLTSKSLCTRCQETRSHYSRPLLVVSAYPAGARLPPRSESESSPLLCRVPRQITRSVPPAKRSAGFIRGTRGVVCTRVMYGGEDFKEKDVGRGTGVKGKGEVRVTGVQETTTLEGGLCTSDEPRTLG
jgi:hypothetical protein